MARVPLTPGAGTGAAYRAVRELIEGVGADRYLAPEIEAAFQYVVTGGAVAAAESVTGPLL